MSEATTITVKAARNVALRTQRLAGKPAGPSAKATLEVIEHLGYVQIDTLSVIERAHHHILWARQPGYDPILLDRLLTQDRTIFEYWTHAASYIPMCDYRFYLGRMTDIRESERVRSWKQANRTILEHVRARIREEGPLASADFEDTRTNRGSWWDWKPAKRALGILFDSGELMVTRRRNFQRHYDLTERVLPANTDTRPPSAEEANQFRIRRVLNRLGIVSMRDLTFKQGDNRDAIIRSLQGLIETGEVIWLRVNGLDDEDCYGLRATVEASARRRVGQRLHLLSPFDSVVIRRDWLERMFDYTYRLECYVPEPKRTYGYFCLPILWGDRFIGRLDAKADRTSHTLIIKQLWFEDDFQDYDDAVVPLAGTLLRFAAFNGCNQITLARIHPGKAATILRSAVVEPGGKLIL